PPRDAAGEAVRPLPAQGDDRGRRRRRSRRLRPRAAGDDLGVDAPLEVRLQPLRGHRGRRRARDRPLARQRPRGGRRARRHTGPGPLREARAVRGAARSRRCDPRLAGLLLPWTNRNHASLMRIVGSLIGARRGRLGLLAVIALTALLTVSASDAATTRAKGLDVSNWNGTISWTKVAHAGYRFAFGKATE